MMTTPGSGAFDDVVLSNNGFGVAEPVPEFDDTSRDRAGAEYSGDTPGGGSSLSYSARTNNKGCAIL